MNSNITYLSVPNPNHCSIAKVKCSASSIICIRGRLLKSKDCRDYIFDETGQIYLDWSSEAVEQFGLGDVVELNGYLGDEGVFLVISGYVLTPALSSTESGDWVKFHNESNKFKLIAQRSDIQKNIRMFFDTHDYIEVETPYLLEQRGYESSIKQFTTKYKSGQIDSVRYLATSPELHMKRLLSVGFERIYQIGRYFRNGELTDLHNPEYTMLEWYRSFADYSFIMNEGELLVKSILKHALSIGYLPDSLHSICGDQQWPRISVREAFSKWADVDVCCLDTKEKLYARAIECGFNSVSLEDTWADMFNIILIERIEPNLSKLGAVFLVDFPEKIESMAKQCAYDSRLVERFELYIGGIELANGYTELNDPIEQRKRCMQARHNQNDVGKLDEEFLKQLTCGMPPSGGVALGVDRLVMLATGAEDLGQVIAFPSGNK